MPLLHQLLHLQLQALDLVTKLLLEEPVGFVGQVPLPLGLPGSLFQLFDSCCHLVGLVFQAADYFTLLFHGDLCTLGLVG
uniref:Uncharacterized protein n=1 Tax=Anguilla anguilla TaxID=7936 RepID=A0A0E9PYX6_ANGAN